MRHHCVTLLILITLTACTAAPVEDMDATPIPTLAPSAEPSTQPTDPPTTEPTESASLTPEATPTSALSLPDFYQPLDLTRDDHQFAVVDASHDGQWLLLESQFSSYDKMDAALDLLNLETGERITIIEEAIAYATAISADGSAVAFMQFVRPGWGDCPQTHDELCGRLYLYDRASATLKQFPLEDADHQHRRPLLRLSGDGRYIAYVFDTGDWLLNILDTQTGSITPVAADVVGAEISYDGQIVSYVRIFSPYPFSFDVFYLDRSTGITTQITTSTGGASSGGWIGVGGGAQSNLHMSIDGRLLLFNSDAPGLGGFDLPVHETTGTTEQHIYLYDHLTGAMEIINVDQMGIPAASGFGIESFSSDARYVVFESNSTPPAGLVDTPLLSHESLFIRDRQRGQTAYIPFDGFAYEFVRGDYIFLRRATIDIVEELAITYRIPIADLFAMP